MPIQTSPRSDVSLYLLVDIKSGYIWVLASRPSWGLKPESHDTTALLGIQYSPVLAQPT